jgi:hypothetical protein
MRRRIFPALLAFAALAASGLSGAPSDAVTATSRPLRLLRSWEEPVKTAGGREYVRRVDLVFDYYKGIAWEHFYSTTGVLTGSKKIAQSLPSPSEVEIDEAFSMVRSAPELERVFARFHPVLEGGFVMEEGKGKPCGPGSRCLHVFVLSSDRAGLIERVVVDLARQKIAYRHYVPPVRRTGR